ncbi:MAG: glycosyltransferase [Chitinivibrionales bacterium]|nr:glycosyltransferase [Chitinivibrionales bacterium]
MRFVIITPVRNEEHYIGMTISSMAAQTCRPDKWVIVDDGSTDRTVGIVSEQMPHLPYLHLIRRSDRGSRMPGQGVVEAFYEGLRAIGDTPYDVVGKMDGDIEFAPDVLEKLMHAFRHNPRLGITGGIIHEPTGRNVFKPRLVPHDTVGGPFKFYRKECFEQIGGLIPRAGWDGADIIRAAMYGWQTGEQSDVRIRHLKPTGMTGGEGLRRSCMKYGDTAYYFGGYLWYFLLRVLLRSLHLCNPLFGFYMVAGYVRSMIVVRERETQEFRAFLRKRQIHRTFAWIRRTVNRSKPIHVGAPAKVGP